MWNKLTEEARNCTVTHSAFKPGHISPKNMSCYRTIEQQLSKEKFHYGCDMLLNLQSVTWLCLSEVSHTDGGLPRQQLLTSLGLYQSINIFVCPEDQQGAYRQTMHTVKPSNNDIYGVCSAAPQ